MIESSSSSSKGEKPLSIGQAAFLLLRVRKVFKKKIAIKKDKPVIPDPSLSSKGDSVVHFSSKSSKKNRVPPLIRSRTVPAIIVPFSILQAHLVKAGGGCAGSGNISPNSGNGPGPSSGTASSLPPHVTGTSKSDYSTPGVDFVQFLTGSGSPSSSVAGTPPSRRETHFLGLSNPSIYRDSPSDSCWNLNQPHSTCSTSNVSPISFSGDSSNGGNFVGPFITPYPHPSPSPFGGKEGKGLSRFARLLNSQLPKTPQQPPPGNWNQFGLVQGTSTGSPSSGVCGVSDIGGGFALSTPSRLPRRRRSLENEDISSCRPRAVSIDSLVRTHFLAPPGGEGAGRSPSPKRYSTSSAGPTCGHRPDPHKIHEGFIAAVEGGNLGKVKTFLETADLDVNGVTIDGLSVLDLAVIFRNRPMVKLLLAHGATDNQYWRKESMSEQLTGMVQESEKKSEDLMAKILKGSTFGNLSPAALKELEKEFHGWEKRYKRFRKMLTEYTQIRPPDPPTKVTLDVIGPTSVKIRLQENESGDNAISTKYKIEWSGSEEFRSGEGTRVMEIFDLRRMETILNDLKGGRRVFFRVSCGNCAGYGDYTHSAPISVIPSSWRDCVDRKGRYGGKSVIFDVIFKQIKDARPEYASEIKSIDFRSVEGVDPTAAPALLGPSYASQQKKNQKIISIKQLFSAAPKFQKNFKRGVFLSCVMYSEDKLLLTTEEFLPTIEIDETFPSTLHNDFHWLLKVACTWEDVKSLKQDMEKSGSASTFHFRLKLLQAAAAMQNALGIGDLGRLYYKTIRDGTNSVVIISIINYVRTTKMISSLNVRWAPLTKMSNRKPTDDISDVLINSIQEQILYHQVSNIPLGKGLYLGYLKLASSVDGPMKIVVPEKTPNILPHAKIRDNPHVSSEEWLLIQGMVKSKSSESLNNMETNNNMNKDEDEDEEDEIGEEVTLKVTTTTTTTTEGQSDQTLQNSEFSEAQDLFRTQLNSAMRKLFGFLEIETEASLSHRLYNAEVVEVNHSVSLIVVFPSLENVCLVAGQSDKLLTRNDLIPLPVQVFEMIHLSTYQKEFITRYARLSTILEVDTVLAQHNHRVAFSADEVALAKQRLHQLQAFQSQLDANWKGSRWVIDVVTLSRDKNSTSASVKTLNVNVTGEAEGLQTSSESIVSADAILQQQKSEGLLGLGLHSKSDQSLRLYGGNLGGGTGIKFSRSENQLATLGIGNSTNPGSPPTHDPSSLLTHPTHPAGGRKVSVPIQCLGPMLGGGVTAAEKLSEKLTFNPKIYSNHSQSDTTISNSVGTQDSVSSASLHNLYRHCSSSQITVPIPSVIVSSGSPIPSPVKKSCPVTLPMRTSPIPPHLYQGKSHPGRRIGTDPPPVPPRRTLPPPPPPDEPSGGADSMDSWTRSGGNVQETEITSPILIPLTGIIQVYAAYDCGLSPGTSVRLQVTNQTTSAQVVDLVVKQLNSEVESKGRSSPIYEQSSDFVLASVIGARERCLRADFRPLHLQNPWKSGRLFVRIKSDVTAAVALSNRRDLTYP